MDADTHIKACKNKKYNKLILIFFVSIIFIFFLQFGQILIFIFPISAFLIGIILYFNCPILYIRFTFLVLFFGELIRRIIDLQSGYLTPGPWSFTPMLVAFISFLSFIREIPKYYKNDGLLFLLSLGSVFYTFLVGLIYENPLDKVIVGSIMWSAPILFGFHLFVSWRNYYNYLREIKNVFLFGTIAMGLYGLLQFIYVPPWENFYLNSEFVSTSFGTPEPFNIRIFSTMNSPFSCSGMLIAGILFFLSSPIKINNFFVILPSLISLILTRVRSGWIGFSVGIFFLFFVRNNKAHKKTYLLIFILFSVIGVILLSSVEPFSSKISPRFQSLFSLEDDVALNVRKEALELVLAGSLFEPLGHGFGTTPLSEAGFSEGDGIILNMLFWFGLFGSLIYLLSIALSFIQLFWMKNRGVDDFSSALFSIAIGILPLAFSANLFSGTLGLLFWSILGSGLASRQYYVRIGSINNKVYFP